MQEDANQIRDCVNVHDVVDAHLLVLQSQQADYQVFNVGSGQVTRVIDLAKAVGKVVGTKQHPVATGEFRINSPRNSVMNIDKLKKLSFEPKRNLEDSVREYVNWVRNYPEAISYWKKTYAKMRREGVLKR